MNSMKASAAMRIGSRTSPIGPITKHVFGIARSSVGSLALIGSAPPSAVVSPLLHQLPAPLEQIGARVGSLGCIADTVGKRNLGNLARMGCLFRAPIAERRTEAMNRVVATVQPLEDFPHRLPVHHAVRAEKHEVIDAELGHSGEDGLRGIAQRHPMLLAAFHPGARDRPYIAIDFAPGA